LMRTKQWQIIDPRKKVFKKKKKGRKNEKQHRAGGNVREKKLAVPAGVTPRAKELNH